MIKVRNPRVLDDNMQEVCRLSPQALSCTLVQLHDSLPTATIALDESSELSGRAFVEVYGVRGSLGVYRVDAVGSLYGESREYRLTHALSTLQDAVIPGQGDFTGTPAELMAMIIDAQTVKRWKLGTVAATGKIKEPISYDNSNAYDSLKALMGLLPGYTLTVNQASYPWTVNIVKQNNTIQSEGRLSRNILSLRTNVDYSSLCTRLWLDGSDRYWDADTVETWGVISRNFSTGSDLAEDATEDVIEAYLEEKVAEYFETHKNPTISIEIDGFDFSMRTNQTIDRVLPGNMYRLALPEYDTMLNERVVSVSFADLLGEPERASIQLNNRTEDSVSRMAGLMVSVVKVEKTMSQVVKETDATQAGLRAFYDEFLIENESWKHTISEVSVQLDAIETTLELKATKTEVNALFSEISQEINNAEIRLDGAEAAIKLKADQTVVDSLGTRVSQAEIDIDGANAEIALKVNKNGVIAAINVSSEEVTIAAKKINLSGYVTTSKLSAEVASLKDAYSYEFTTGTLTAGRANIQTLYLNGYGTYVTSGKGIVTAVTLPTVSTDYITYMDANMDLVQQKVVTGFYQGKVTTDTISYVGALSV